MEPPANDPHEWHFALFEPSHDIRLGIAIRGVARPRLFMSQHDGDERTLLPIRGSAKLIFSNKPKIVQRCGHDLESQNQLSELDRACS